MPNGGLSIPSHPTDTAPCGIYNYPLPVFLKQGEKILIPALKKHL